MKYVIQLRNWGVWDSMHKLYPAHFPKPVYDDFNDIQQHMQKWVNDNPELAEKAQIRTITTDENVPTVVPDVPRD